MMKLYIFYTTQGYTEDSNTNKVNNCQVLDWQEGRDANEAFENFKKEIQTENFDQIYCQELVNGNVYYF